MTDMDALREALSELEHQQWESWSKSLSQQLTEPDDTPVSSLKDVGRNFVQKRTGWRRYWKPYSELSHEVQEFDREWADKVIEILKVHGVTLNE